MQKEKLEFLKEKAAELRKDVITMIYEAQSGHPGGSLSAADFVAALYFSEMKVDPKNPKWPDRDRFVLSKGHACPIQYAALAELGYFDKSVLSTLRKEGSILQGHPDMKKCPGIDTVSYTHLDVYKRQVDAQIIVLRVAPGLVAVILIEAGTILIDLFDLFASLSLVKTLALLKALDARIGVAEDKYADNIVSVVEDIVGAAADEDAVFLGCDLADRVELCGNYLHVQTEILIQAIAACVQQES